MFLLFAKFLAISRSPLPLPPPPGHSVSRLIIGFPGFSRTLDTLNKLQSKKIGFNAAKQENNYLFF